MRVGLPGDIRFARGCEPLHTKQHDRRTSVRLRGVLREPWGKHQQQQPVLSPSKLAASPSLASSQVTRKRLARSGSGWSAIEHTLSSEHGGEFVGSGHGMLA